MRFTFSLILTLIFSLSVSATTFYSSPTTGTAGASTQALAQNNLRSYLLVQNLGSTVLIVKFGSTISGSNEGVQIPGGGSYELQSSAPANSVWVKALSGSPTYVILQGTGN